MKHLIEPAASKVLENCVDHRKYMIVFCAKQESAKANNLNDAVSRANLLKLFFY